MYLYMYMQINLSQIEYLIWINESDIPVIFFKETQKIAVLNLNIKMYHKSLLWNSQNKIKCITKFNSVSVSYTSF